MPNKNLYLKLIASLADQFSYLQSSLLEVSSGQPLKSILVTSSKSGEGKTLAAIGMATTLAQGKDVKVLLMDANFKSPKLHQIFDLPQQPGLSELIMGRSPVGDICQSTSMANLKVLTNGTGQDNMSSLFDAGHFADSLKQLSLEYDYIVADSHSFLGTSEVSLICPLFDAVLLVVECEATKWQVVETVAQKVEKAGGHLLGTILNRRKFYIPGCFYG